MLRLSRGMAYKNAVAGLDHGGGKAVIIGDPATDKTEALLRAYGRFVESLGGRYVTACDVGTYVADMDVVGKETRHATGRSEADGGAGDSSVLTAFGVFQGMRASAEHVWGTPTLAGRTVGVAGVGKVGRLLAAHLIEDGAHVVVTDVSEQAVEAVRATLPPGRRRTGRRGAGQGRPGRLRPVRPRRRPGRLHGRVAERARSSAGRPTTSWPTRASTAPPSGCWSAASSTRRTSWSTPAA